LSRPRVTCSTGRANLPLASAGGTSEEVLVHAVQDDESLPVLRARVREIVNRTNGYIGDQFFLRGVEAYQLLSDDHHAVLDRVRLAVVAVATRDPSADCKDCQLNSQAKQLLTR
jgi:hypothetical protein